MNKIIPLSVPNIKGNELKYVTKALNTEWVSTNGGFVEEFERAIAEYVDAKGAVSCQNGTAGLHVSLLLCGVKDGDEVIVPTLTFIAAVNPVKYVGAQPVFMDCDDSLTIDPVKLKQFCVDECSFTEGELINNKTGRRIKAVVVVHVFGNMADMEEIMKIAHEYNLKVIEDATEALGTYYLEGAYKGKFAGTIGDVGVYSFNGNKIITTGGGGMIVSDDEELLSRAKHLTTQAKVDDTYYIHDEVGYNYRMTNIQAAVGLGQLERLEEFIEVKRDNYTEYKHRVSDIPGLSILNFRSCIRPNYWFYSLELGKQYPLSRDGLISYFKSRNVQSRPIWGLISDQKPFLETEQYKIEKAKYYCQRIVNIPCSTNLSRQELLYVVNCLKDANGGRTDERR